jgi:hypothetical protein
MKSCRNSLAKLSMPVIACATTLIASQAHAQNGNFAPGDLVLFFQQEGGSGTVYANLGTAATLFRGTSPGAAVPNMINFLNISTTLNGAFGPGWASDPTVYAGLAAVWRTSDTSTGVLNGDPSRTVYISRSRLGVATVGSANSTQWIIAGDTQMTSAASGIFAQNNILETVYSTAVAQSPTSISFIDNQNPFFTAGIQGSAMDEAFEGGVQQAGNAGSFGSYGAAGNVEFALDLYRILGRNDLVQVGGTVRQGSYEGTVTVNSSGQVSFISQTAPASSPYDTWMATFTSITAPADKLETADPDGDGFKNLMEFVLNGNPSVSNTAIAPTRDASGSNFVFNFNRRDDSESPETTLVFQHSSNLSTWTDVTIGPSTAGVVTVNENGAAADGIIVTIPKGVNTKLFGRLKVVR